MRHRLSAASLERNSSLRTPCWRVCTVGDANATGGGGIWSHHPPRSACPAPHSPPGLARLLDYLWMMGKWAEMTHGPSGQGREKRTWTSSLSFFPPVG